MMYYYNKTDINPKRFMSKCDATDDFFKRNIFAYLGVNGIR